MPLQRENSIPVDSIPSTDNNSFVEENTENGLYEKSDNVDKLINRRTITSMVR